LTEPGAPAVIQHGFLLEPAIGRATGVFLDGGGRTRPAAGETSVRHLAGRWQVHTLIRIETSKPGRFENSYEVAPFTSTSASTPWRAVSPMLGPILGRFILVDDTILSTSSTEDGRYQGGEVLRLLVDGQYENRGWLALGAEVASRWRMRLDRKG
jgi:hypothetical protein